MTTRADKIGVARNALAKTVRSRVRLQYSIACDEELNKVLPDALDAFDDSVMSGKLPDLEELLAEFGV